MNSVAVEFDTWYNYELNDYYEHHIAIQTGGLNANNPTHNSVFSNWGREDSEKQVLLNILLLERGPGTIWEGAREGPEQSGDGNAKMSALFQINTDCNMHTPKAAGCSQLELHIVLDLQT